MNGRLNDRDLTDIEDGEEQENNAENGYELLPTSHAEDEDDSMEFGVSTFDGEEFFTRTSHDYHNLVTIESAPPTKYMREKPSIPLDSLQIETIKSIMSNVTLPSTVIPPWAESVSDDQLKQVVDEKVGQQPNENWAVFD